MTIFVAGATGVLGRRVVAFAAEDDHAVRGLTRDDRGDEIVREAGGEPVRGDVLDRSTLEAAAEGADVFVNAATRIPTSRKPSEADWQRNDRVRRRGTENLIETAASVDATRFVQQSVVWVVRQPDGRPFDETADPHPDRTTRSALDAERTLERGTEEHGFEGVILRGGMFYGSDADSTIRFGSGLISGRMPIVGGGILGRTDANLSWIHVDDAARAFAKAATGDAEGVYHVVDNEPASVGEHMVSLARLLGAPAPRRVPAWLARFIIGSHTVRLLTSPMPTSNERFSRTFDWNPSYPTHREGLVQVVEAWERDGRIREGRDGYSWVGK